MNSFRDIIRQGIEAEQEAIRYYTFILPFIHDGNDRRSILHILNEEKDHLKILEKMIRKY